MANAQTQQMEELKMPTKKPRKNEDGQLFRKKKPLEKKERKLLSQMSLDMAVQFTIVKRKNHQTYHKLMSLRHQCLKKI